MCTLKGLYVYLKVSKKQNVLNLQLKISPSPPLGRTKKCLSPLSQISVYPLQITHFSETNSKLAEVPGVAPENLNKKSIIRQIFIFLT